MQNELANCLVTQLNRYVMTVVFFIPLSIIALYESTARSRKNKWMRDWLTGTDQGETDNPTNKDPVVDDGECDGLKISKVTFAELVKSFPDTTQVGHLSLSWGCIPDHAENSRPKRLL